jgi:hypothetical protein
MSTGEMASSNAAPGNDLTAVRDRLRGHPVRSRILALIEEDKQGSLDRPDDLRRRLSPDEPGAATIVYHLAVLRRAGILPARRDVS